MGIARVLFTSKTLIYSLTSQVWLNEIKPLVIVRYEYEIMISLEQNKDYKKKIKGG